MLPVLCILDTSVPHDRQQWVLKAMKEAEVWQSSKPSVIYNESRLRDLKTACEEGNISALVSYKHNHPMIHVDVFASKPSCAVLQACQATALINNFHA